VTKRSNNYYKKYRGYYFGGGIVIISWISYLLTFAPFYQEMVFYVDKSARYLVQLIFISSFYLPELLVYTFIYFLLMLTSLFLLFFFYFKNKKEKEFDKKKKYVVLFFVLIIIIPTIFLLRTIAWPYFLLVLITSLTVVYITYAITKYLYEEQAELYKDGDCVKELGSFRSIEEAHEYGQEFSKYWKSYFEEKGYSITELSEKEENGTYKIALYIKAADKS